MEIMNPLLPPKAGYVEVIDDDGNHVYKPTKETVYKQKQETKLAGVDATVNMLLGYDADIKEPSAAEMRAAIQLFANTIEDETQMMEIATIYPEYQIGRSYKTKDIFRYGKNSVGDPQLYQVLQDHTSAAEWSPETSTSLYKKVGVTEDGIPQWVQPLGATDAYDLGDIVMHNGKKWESVVDANVWEPGVYGWEEVTGSEPEPDPEEPSQEDIPEFVQPTGAHDAYNIGDRVLYNGQVYESLIAGNTYSPDAYPSGWRLINQ